MTGVFALVVGLERVFHLDEMEDTGFALLTGGRRHTIPRWTHEFPIPKGYVTTRNKYVRCEKLSYTYDVLDGRYLAVRATPGDGGLSDLAVPLLRQALRCGHPDYVHALQGAGAGPSDAAVRTLWDLVEQENPRLDVTPLQMIGWLVALVYNAAADWAVSLAGDWKGCPVRTLRRTFWNRPGTLYQTPEAPIVQLDRFGGQEAVEPAVDAFNAEGHRLPWLENRQVVVSLTPTARSRGDP